ncbi:hypothetical protein CSB37_00385 [bacterium DOLZORAL124_38_8]|nr:MAG: hypothetical protein CSB37_00385 [bacterium DOLZORAL124_38_8]
MLFIIRLKNIVGSLEPVDTIKQKQKNWRESSSHLKRRCELGKEFKKVLLHLSVSMWKKQNFFVFKITYFYEFVLRK